MVTKLAKHNSTVRVDIVGKLTHSGLRSYFWQWSASFSPFHWWTTRTSRTFSSCHWWRSYYRITSELLRIVTAILPCRIVHACP